MTLGGRATAVRTAHVSGRCDRRRRSVRVGDAGPRPVGQRQQVRVRGAFARVGLGPDGGGEIGQDLSIRGVAVRMEGEPTRRRRDDGPIHARHLPARR